MNADDVIFSFERQLDPKNPWHAYVNGAVYEYFQAMGFNTLVKSIDKVDDYTVKFTLNHPSAPFLADLGMDFSSIMSKEYADQLQKSGNMQDLNQKPVGTGPFEFVAYQPDAVIRYKANADYWHGKEKIDDLVFAITPDASVRAQKLKSGECQIMPYPNAADVSGLKSDPNLKVMEQAGLNVAYLAYNTTQKPFDNVKVRKALNMAVDRKAIVKAVFQGMAEVASNPIPPTMWSYDHSIKNEPYDPDQGEEDARRRRRQEPADEDLGDARLAPLHAERASGGGDHPGGLGQDRRQGADRHLRMGRVPQARRRQEP